VDAAYTSSTKGGKVMCDRCNGDGWYWRMPDGFNPFNAGLMVAARKSFKQVCACGAPIKDGEASK
jgi:hypothetical protein